MTARLVGICFGLLMLGMVSKSALAQHHHHHHHSGHAHYSTPYYNNYSSHHHHDAAGHRVDDYGHHVDNHGHHTGPVGVYDNGATDYYRPAYGYTPTYSTPIPQNNISYRPAAPPPVPRTGLPIVISLPANAEQEVRYLLNGYPYSIKPGYQQQITDDRAWEIAFGSGGNKGNLRYSLAPGKFDFRLTDGGLDIVRDTTTQVSASGF